MSEKEFKPRKKASEERQSSRKISMDAWISLRLAQDKKLRSSQRREMEIYLQKQGLTALEESERYEEAFKKF